MRRRTRPQTTAAIAAAALLLAGCGPDGDDAASGPADVEITLTEYSIGMVGEPGDAPAVFEVTNKGHAHHNLTICPTETGDECTGDPVEHDMLMRPEAARDPSFYDDRSDTLTIGKEWVARVGIDLEPGTYRFFCGIISHAARGMQRTVVIEPGA